MQSIFNSARVVGAGALSAGATAFLAAAIYRVFEYDVFSFTLGDWVPVGAVACGCLAAMGLYAACILLNVRANTALLVVSILIGAAAYVLTYLFQFLMLRSELPASISFFDYFALLVTGEDLSVDVVQWSVGLGAIGEFGYLFAALNFLGVSAGGYVAYTLVAGRPWCETCQRFRRTIAMRLYYFVDEDEYRRHFQRTGELDPASREFAEHFAVSGANTEAEGAHCVSSTLFGCRKCGGQTLEETVQAHDGKGWKHLLEDERKLDLPVGLDLTSIFRVDDTPATTPETAPAASAKG